MLITVAKQKVLLNQFTRFSSFLFLILLFLLVITASNNTFAETQIISARYWAGADYTRLTLESDKPIRYSISTLDSPKRIVMDLENTRLSSVLKDLSKKPSSQDPLVDALRIGRFTPKIARLVVDLKTDVHHKSFVLQPEKRFGHRLVLDIKATVKPTQAQDPLMSLLQKDAPPLPAKKTAPAQAAQKLTPVIAANRQSRKKSKIIIAIDAGHGGKDPGAIGPRGTQEKNITLAIARKLKAKLDKQPGMRAVLVRDGDYFLSLAERRARARRASADLFISVHADAAPRKSAHGASIYALSEHGATSTTASWLAKKENESDLIGGVKLDDKDRYLKQTLIDLSMNATIDDSIRMASSVLNEIGTINHLHKKTVEQAGFAVLRSPDIPSILVETAFISNYAEEAKLNSASYQNKLTDAIVTGLKRYSNSRSWQTRTEVAQTP